VLPLRGAVHVGECRSTHRAGQLRRLPSLQRDACLLHVSEHVLRLRGAPTLKGGITIGSPKDVTKESRMQQVKGV
jgi:hypothetical protein